MLDRVARCHISICTDDVSIYYKDLVKTKEASICFIFPSIEQRIILIYSLHTNPLSLAPLPPILSLPLSPGLHRRHPPDGRLAGSVPYLLFRRFTAAIPDADAASIATVGDRRGRRGGDAEASRGGGVD